MAFPNAGKAKSHLATNIILAAVFTLSVSGFFMGLRQTGRETEATQASSAESSQTTDTVGNAIPAPSYADIAQAGFSPNANWKSRLSDLAPHDDLDTVRVTDPAELRYRREQRRAYDGSPPIVPHPIDQWSADSCMQCHERAVRIGDVVAPAMSHPAYTSCTQCHVSGKGLGSRWNASDFDLHTGNRFGGYHQPEFGERAYPDAPPTIPHNVHMRQNCMSCHGELGTSPIRTSHPERQSCVQCHVPGGKVDEMNFSESPFPFWESLSKGDPVQ
ncbi:nitrate reductase cytochrome c-type subunit [Pelagicoccus mobilis]|uniref:Periplasmic nitrate reductase, electron transfer subunit n=1 Tax=Pelagicoccus mobilis TaxID=415221 RepID=A0A934S6L2_9BACT|nr:nitrate reductase cytochrome c-type subunit [Pelagicoccus mobilis]MBK1879888.1 hypothetical protein [Pelagicoccus mobilis]